MKHRRIIIFVLIFSLFITSFFVFTASMERERTENTNVVINFHNRVTNWVGETNTSFTGGYGECVASDGKYIYILRQWKAGYSPSFNRYDPITDSWTDLSGNLPAVDFKNGVAITYDYSGNFYVLTGSAYADGSDRVIFYKYNISSDTWIKLADTPHVQGAGDAIVYSSYNNMVYAFMGRAEYTGSYVPSEKSVFGRYDPQANTWTILNFPNWEGTDDGCSLAWTGGKYIYALQGEFYENEPSRNFARYNIDTDTWENMSEIPAKDGVGDGGSLLWIGHYNSSYSNVIFAFDGNGCNETPGYNFSAYYINNDTWVHLGEIPAPVGYYVGNRLVYASDKIWYWQGTPSSWNDGTGVYSWDYKEMNVPEIPTSMVVVIIAMVVFLSCLRGKRR